MKRFLLIFIEIAAVPYLLNAQKTVRDSVRNDTVNQAICEISSKIPYYKTLRLKHLEVDTIYDSKLIRKNLRNQPDYKRWTFAIGAGIGTRIAQDPANLPDDLEKYRKGLKIGTCFGANTSFFISPRFAVGLGYTLFDLGNSADFMSYEEPKDNFFEGSRSDDILVHFFGPTLTIRIIPKRNKLHAWYSFMLGYSAFSNNLKINDNAYKFTGNSFGFSSTVGADFIVSNDFAAGIALRLSAASVKNLKVLDYEVTSPEINSIENLSRVNLVLFLKLFQ